MIRSRYSAQEFVRLHRIMLSHLALGTAAAWSMAVYAGLNAPWVGNIVFLIDPTSSRAQTTGTYLFTYPAILLVALGVVYFGRDMLFRLRIMRNQMADFALAGATLFTIFILSIERAIAALRLGWL